MKVGHEEIRAGRVLLKPRAEHIWGQEKVYVTPFLPNCHARHRLSELTGRQVGKRLTIQFTQVLCVCVKTHVKLLTKKKQISVVLEWKVKRLPRSVGFSDHHKCLYKVSWQSIQQLLRYLSLKQSGGPANWHCHPWSNITSMTKIKIFGIMVSKH